VTGRVLPFPTTAKFNGAWCPEWCEWAATGHDFAFGLDDSDPPVYHRLHRLRLGDLAEGQARLDLHQMERTTDPAKPGDFDRPEIVLSIETDYDDGFMCIPDADALREFITSLQEAAARLENPGTWPL
jgi:hypothetical protein